MMVSKQQLAIFLSQLQVFPIANVTLEQYPTDGDIAASILWEAYMQGEIENKRVADFGCGTGILGIGALALGAKHVYFIELDTALIPILVKNIELVHEKYPTIGTYEIVSGNISHFEQSVDTVIENPPFGTRTQHADILFLEKAITLGKTTYSLHKQSTKDYLDKWLTAHHKSIVGSWPYKFPLKRSMQHHTKRIEYVAVVCLKIQ